MGQKNYFVYILTNHLKTVLYIGVTNDLSRRITEHKERCGSEFASRYQLTSLVYYEETTDVHAAIQREKSIKGLLRCRKESLITALNPRWRDLSDDF
jgi:putative endonuclease